MNLIEDTFKFCTNVTIGDLGDLPIPKDDVNRIIEFCKDDPRNKFIRCSLYGDYSGEIEYGLLFPDDIGTYLPDISIRGTPVDRLIRLGDYGDDYRHLTSEEVESLVLLLEAYYL